MSVVQDDYEGGLRGMHELYISLAEDTITEISQATGISPVELAERLQAAQQRKEIVVFTIQTYYQKENIPDA